MFCNCSSLQKIPNISNWNTSNVKYLGGFYESVSAQSPITDFEIIVENEDYLIKCGMFYNCSSLTELPDISNWNTNKLTNFDFLFSKCILIESLPDISKWNTNNVIVMNELFSGCHKLKSLPDISKWNTDKVTGMIGTFEECYALKELPDIGKWNIDNVLHFENIFSETGEDYAEDFNIPKKFIDTIEKRGCLNGH